LRWISRLTVDGERPSSRAIARRLAPPRSKSAIAIRSASDKYLGLRNFGSVSFTAG
jgi:hypothetical protein